MNGNTGWEQLLGRHGTRWFVYKGYWMYAVHKVRLCNGKHAYQISQGRARLFYKTLPEAKRRVFTLLMAAGKEL